MKKIILITFITFLLTGCNNKNLEIDTEINIDETIKIDEYIDNNPIKVAFYQGKNKVKNYKTTLGNFKDFAVFDIYYTDIDTLDSSNTKNNYKKYYNQYENIDNYKTGFYISFEAEGKTIEKLILDPSGQHSMAPYVYVYLYDDVNQPDGTYYSHLEPKDMKENTVISSIKLFFAHKGTSITSPISITVFTYDSEDDFTKDNHYRGTSSYKIDIKTK